jgi:hypothetical protein
LTLTIYLCLSVSLSFSVHKYPFSLFNETKRENSGAKIERVGNVTELLDKSIGRSVIRIKGSVSANNFIDYNSLNLEGNFLYLQICLLKSSVATLHFELLTTKDISLRVTISTLYDHPRFLGRSLRLPLPARVGWTNLVIDVNEILSVNCPKNFGLLKCIKVPVVTFFISHLSSHSLLPPPSASSLPLLRLHSPQRVQICSNMAIRDCVTSNISLSPSSHVSQFVILASPSS